MPRSRINGNFIDKTSSIVANILLRIIPTTSGEKKAFTYYRDGAIWFFFLVFFLALTSVLRERDAVRYRKNEILEINLRSVKVKFGDRTIPSIAYPRLMQPQMFQLLIWVLSERLHLWVLYCGSILHYISTNRRHKGKSTTPRNQQHKNFVINSPFPYRYRD